MSVKNLYESFQDRERVPKIQGLLNECMTFLDDELSVVTGPYEELLSLDDVIEQELILFVTLNVNKNSEPVRALGKMLLQNLQLVVGKRYESDAHRRRPNRPLLSVVLDEFAPFGYRNFPQILQTARGTNTAFLFSTQSLPQLMQVGRGFKEDVTSAPNTTITMRTRDEETAQYFLQASAEHRITRRNLSMERRRFFGFERYQETGRAVDVETRETRALDEHIKNLPKGQMQILMTDDTRGTLHAHLHVRPPTDVTIPHFEPELYPRLRQSRATSKGANLRFKAPGVLGKPVCQAGALTMWKKTRHVMLNMLLTATLCLASTAARAQQPKRPYFYRETWYEALLKKCNPTNFDYGSWFEQRRQAFLDATVNQPQFWYSLWVTAFGLLVVAFLWKRLIDASRKLEAMETAVADVYNHDLYSRQVAKEVTEKYNEHMEQCNRAFETSEAGEGRPGWGDGQLDSVKAELQRVSAQLEATTQERNKLQEELRQKSVIVSDLSLRLDGLSKKINAGVRSGSEEPSPNGKGRAAWRWWTTSIVCKRNCMPNGKRTRD